jgi:recombination protein RecA
VIFINQLRMKIGGYGNPETTSGGMALKFYSSVRVEVRKGEALKEKDVVYGFTTKIKIAKNKMAAPFRTAEFMVLFDKGPYNMSCILEEAVKLEILKKSGAWYYYGEERIGQGRENVFNYLEGKPELAKKLEKEIKQKYDISYYDGDEKKQPSEEQPKAKGKKASKKVEVEEDLL